MNLLLLFLIRLSDQRALSRIDLFCLRLAVHSLVFVCSPLLLAFLLFLIFILRFLLHSHSAVGQNDESFAHHQEHLSNQCPNECSRDLILAEDLIYAILGVNHEVKEEKKVNEDKNLNESDPNV